MQHINSTIPVSLLSKYRGCLMGAIIGDCMGARFEKSAEPFAMVASRIEPSSLRNQIPRNGGRFLFPYGVDSVMLLASGESVAGHVSSRGDPSDLSKVFLDSLRKSLEDHTTACSSVKWGVGTRNLLESDYGRVDFQLRSNCGITRALVAGLVPSPEVVAESLCCATHKHDSAIEGAKLVARSVNLALREERMIQEDDVQHKQYHSIVTKARSLATAKEYSEDDEFNTHLQDRFGARFGRDASSQCSIAAMIFSIHRTIHSLPYLDIASEEYRRRIETLAKAGLDKEKGKIGKNVMGNSNRMDTALLFSKLTPSIEQDLPVALAIGWAISLGGDVRSNACLAGGLAGALWGDQAIPDEWTMFCEGMDEARDLADSLFKVSNS